MQDVSLPKTEQEAGTIDVFFFVLLALLGLCCVFLAATIVRHFLSRETGYGLTATTELVSVALHDQGGARIRLADARIRSQDAAEQDIGPSSLRLADGVTATLQRLQKNELRISLDWPDGLGERAQLITRDGREIPIANHQTLAVPADKSRLTFVFRGRVTLGQTQAKEIEGVLLRGRVAVYQKPWFGDARLLVSDATLDLGDYPVWVAHAKHDKDDPCVRTPSKPDEGEPENACVAGFVHISDDEAMQIVVHAEAEHVTVRRFGAHDYQIAPTWWDEFAHDPYVSASAAIAGFVATLLMLYELLPKVYGRAVKVHQRVRERLAKRS